MSAHSNANDCPVAPEQPQFPDAPGAHLYPLIGRRVDTPDGPGVLLQVFTSRATMRLDADPDHTHDYSLYQIGPEREETR